MQVKECVFKTTDIILGFSNNLWKFCGMEAKYMESQERKEIPEIFPSSASLSKRYMNWLHKTKSWLKPSHCFLGWHID